MPKLSKTRGTGYEYRIRDWFRNEKQSKDKPPGWEAERNSLSREEKSFGETVAKHDVKAWKDVNDTDRIFLQIEAKKTGKDVHTIQKEWIDKIDFFSDELLVIALNRTGHFAVIDIEAMPNLLGVDNNANNQMVVPSDVCILELEEKAGKIVKCRGKKSVRIHKSDVEAATFEAPMLLNWENIERKFVVFPLIDYVRLREQRPPNRKIPLHDKLAEDDDMDNIPTVEVDINSETIISSPYDDRPIKLIPKTTEE